MSNIDILKIIHYQLELKQTMNYLNILNHIVFFQVKTQDYLYQKLITGLHAYRSD